MDEQEVHMMNFVNSTDEYDTFLCPICGRILNMTAGETGFNVVTPGNKTADHKGVSKDGQKLYTFLADVPRENNPFLSWVQEHTKELYSL